MCGNEPGEDESVAPPGVTCAERVRVRPGAFWSVRSMEFRRVRALRGPNIWAYSPVLEAYIDLKEWKDTSSAMILGFTDRLMAWLPGLIEHECSEEHRGGFLVRLNEGTY